jgi:hypothetical protein
MDPLGMRTKGCALKVKTQSQVDADLSCSNGRMPGGFARRRPRRIGWILQHECGATIVAVGRVRVRDYVGISWLQERLAAGLGGVFGGSHT